MKTTAPARKKTASAGAGGGEGSWLLKLALRSDPGLLCAVRGAVERLTESLGFTAADCRAVTRAVDEALTNIIRHAYAGAPDQLIELAFRAAQGPGDGIPGGLEIVMRDRGPAVDPEKLCGRALGDVKPGGLGLHFIRQSMDVVEFKRANGANHLRLVKYVRAPNEAVTLAKR